MRTTSAGTFLDVAARLDYLVELGCNAIQLLPILEFETPTSLGYNGTDLYSPEVPYCVTPDELDWRLAQIDEMLARFRKPSITKA